MLFHTVKGAATGSSSGREMGQIELSKKADPAKFEVKTAPLVWVTVIIVIFIVSTFVAHGQQFAAAETIFLNLTVSITSAAIGAFIGERMSLAGR